MIRNFFSRLMYGRYGSDQLNIFLFVIFLAVVAGGYLCPEFAGLLHPQHRLSGGAVDRLLPDHEPQLQPPPGENDAFLKVFGPLIHWFKRKRNQARDKDHVYFKCPTCSQVLRVPRGKGKISITCRNCGTVFRRKRKMDRHPCPPQPGGGVFCQGRPDWFWENCRRFFEKLHCGSQAQRPDFKRHVGGFCL